MSIEKELEARSGGVCELCGSSEGLSALEVAPSDGSAEQSIYVCATCKEQIQNPDKMDETHFNCLNDSMWSEVPAVAVMSYRLLKALGREDLVDMMYMEDDVKSWAEAG
ncbi:MAG TPA: PhnA domain protein, partial [Sulfurimonas sp.]